MKTKAIYFEPAITDEILTHPDVNDGNPFVIDLESMLLPGSGETLNLDFNHGNGVDDLIGSCFNFSVAEVGLLADGVLVSLKEDDLADKLIQKMKAAKESPDLIKPPGSSPRIVLDDACSEDIPAGETIDVRGKPRTGPFRFYKSGVLEGLTVTPYPTDKKSRVVLLSKAKGVVLLASFNPIKEKKTMADTETTTPEGEETTSTTTALKLLADKIGPDKALEAYEKAGGDESGLQKILDAFDVLAENGIDFPEAAKDVAELSLDDDEEKSPEILDEAVKEIETLEEEDEKKKSLTTAELAKIVKPLVKQIALLSKQNNSLAAAIKASSSGSALSGSNTDRDRTPPKTGYDRDAEAAKLKDLVGY